MTASISTGFNDSERLPQSGKTSHATTLGATYGHGKPGGYAGLKVPSMQQLDVQLSAGACGGAAWYQDAENTADPGCK